MKFTLLFSLLFASFFIFGQDMNSTDPDPEKDMIGDNYDPGSFLIYVCEENHWLCVTEEFYAECGEKRKRDLASVDETKHSCAPIGGFPTKKSCFQRQLFLTTHNHGDRFCIKDQWKEKTSN